MNIDAVMRRAPVIPVIVIDVAAHADRSTRAAIERDVAFSLGAATTADIMRGLDIGFDGSSASPH